MNTRFKKAMALCMAVIMVLSVGVVFAYNADSASDASDLYTDDYLLAAIETTTPSAITVYNPNVVIYNLGRREVIVGHEGDAFADSFFDENGHYIIQLEDDAFFPYEIQFQWDGRTFVEWFMTPQSVVHVGEYMFGVYSAVADSSVITQINLGVGNQVVPVFPEAKTFTNYAFDAFSLLPLEERRFIVRFFDESFTENPDNIILILPEDIEIQSIHELRTVRVDTFFSGQGSHIPAPYVVWARIGHTSHQLILYGDSIDLTKGLAQSDQTSDIDVAHLKGIIELIVGDGNQFNPNNIRYILEIEFNSEDGFISDEPIGNIEVDWAVSTSPSSSASMQELFWRMWTTWATIEDGVYINWFRFNEHHIPHDRVLWPQFTLHYMGTIDSARIFKGQFDNIANALAYGEEIAVIDELNDSGFLDLNYTVYNNTWRCWGYFTAVFEQNGVPVSISLPFMIRAEIHEDQHATLSRVGETWSASDTGWELDAMLISHVERNIESDAYGTILTSAYVLNGTNRIDPGTLDPLEPFGNDLYIAMDYFIYDSNYFSNFDSVSKGAILRTVQGHFTSVEDISAQEDITKNLFWQYNDYPTVPFKGNFSGDGKDFTVLDIYGNILRLTIRIVDEYYWEPPLSPPPAPPTPPPPSTLPPHLRPGLFDPFFRITGAAELLPAGIYIVPTQHDSYVAMGFQSVLVLDENANLTSLRPTFTTETADVNVFAGHIGAAGTLQASGQNPHNFINRNAVQFSVAEPETEHGASIRNYWVTFAQRTTNGPNLFVNGINGSQGAVREVFFNAFHGYHHDIFIANIGNAPLTGLTVTLTDEQNIRLDDYWTVRPGGYNTMAAFTTTTPTTEFGELPNVGKIRLIPDGRGEISGNLTISGNNIPPLTITLRGFAGNPEITTQSPINPPAVQFVPYEAILFTDNMHPWKDITFTGGEGLPPGMELRSHGVIYGVPLQTGVFTFPVTMHVWVDGELIYSQTQQFTLNVLPNTDENVEGETDENFHLIRRIPDMATTGFTDHIMESAGAYAYFIDLWLNGVRLIRDTDYEAEEGSTVITVWAQTFEGLEPGVHTIAAEFREGGEEDGTLRRSAQNFGIGTTTTQPPITQPPTTDPTEPPTNATQPPTNATQPPTNATQLPTNPGSTSPGGAEPPPAATDPTEPFIGGATSNDNNDAPPIPQSNQPAAVPVPAVQDDATEISTNDETTNDDPPTPFIPTFDNPFGDISPDDWFYHYVVAMFQRGLVQGTAPGQFEPYVTTNRAMVVQLLFNLQGQPTVSGTNAFNDVSSDAWYAEAVTWANTVGIVSGFGDGTFSAGGDITRAHLALILDNYARITGLDMQQNHPPTTFADMGQISDYALDAIMRFNQAGIIGGRPDGSFDPQAGGIRAELAAMLYRFLEAVGQ